MYTYSETLGFGCRIFTKTDEYNQVSDGVMCDDKVILSYNNQSRTLRLDYRAFCGQRMRAIKKFLGDEKMYEFIRRHKGEDTTYGEAGNDDNPPKHIIRFI